VFLIGGLLLWLPIMLLIALLGGLGALAKLPVWAVKKPMELAEACNFFGFTYCILSVPVVFFLRWIRPRSRLHVLFVALPFSIVIPLLAILILIPTFYWALYAVVFVLMTWNAAPILWAIAAAELRWRIERSQP
jgi:hypothetical protein